MSGWKTLVASRLFPCRATLFAPSGAGARGKTLPKHCLPSAAKTAPVSEPYLLDTSALLTLIEDEDGAAWVETLLKEHDVFVPWLCLLELHYISQQEQGLSEANKRYALLRATNATFLWHASETLLLTAAGYKANHKLSLADTIIAAFAAERGAILVHKDPEYEVLEGEVRLEPLPYKK